MQAADGVASTAALYEEASRTEEVVPALQIGAVIPDFTAETSQGEEMEFYVEIDGKWSCFLSFYKTFDPVATSEMAALSKLHDEFVLTMLAEQEGRQGMRRSAVQSRESTRGLFFFVSK
jgi:hypothetical protein